MKTLPPELLEQLAVILAGHEFGRTNLTLSQSKHEITKAEVITSIPERFNHDNAAAMGYINTKLRSYQSERVNGTIGLELKYKDGDLIVVTETRTW